MKVPITRPALGVGEEEALLRVLRSGWIAQGPEVAAFEQDFAAAVGASQAVAVANCTVAMELALRVAGVGRGDEVVTVSHSFIATANAIVNIGAVPVFVDIEPDTFGMDPRRVADALGPRTRAILAVHQLGFPCDLEALLGFGVPVIEDAACAIGSEVQRAGRWERIGRPHGLMACFSLHPRKIVTTGEGGMITTGDPALAARLRLLRQHAMTVSDTVRSHSQTVIFEEYSEPAYNLRMTDLQAAVGRPQLARLDEIVGQRRALADRYAARLDGSAVVPPRERPHHRVNWQSYPVALAAGVDQVRLLQHLLDRGVSAKRGVHNAHQEPAYATRSGWRTGPGGLAVSEQARDRTILLPLFHGMTPAEQDHVVAAVRAFT